MTLQERAIALCQQAQSHYDQGDWAAGLQAAKGAIHVDPTGDRAYACLTEGLIWLDRPWAALRSALWGNLRDAAPDADPATGRAIWQQQQRSLTRKSSVERRVILDQLAMWFCARQQWYGAIACLRIFLNELTEDERSLQGWLAYAQLWHDVWLNRQAPGRFAAIADRIIAAYLQVIWRNPSHLDSYHKLAVWLAELGLTEAAQQCGRKWMPVSVLTRWGDRAIIPLVPLAELAIDQPLAEKIATDPTLAAIATDQIAADQITVRRFPELDQPLELPPSRSPWPDQPPHPALDAQTFQPEAAWVAEIPGGRWWSDHFTHVAFTAEGQAIADLSHGSAELVASSPYLPPPQVLPGTALVLSVAGGTMFCHWLCNVLVRLAMVEAAGWDWEAIEWVVVNAHDAAYQRHTLELLQIPPDKIIASVPDHCHWQGDRLLVPARVDHMPRWGWDYLRRTFLRPDILAQSPIRQRGQRGDRLFISRRHAAYRRVVDDDAIETLLVQRGFTVVYLETFGFAEQVAMMAQAQVIVAPHGAGLTHLLFCAPGTVVLELFAPSYVPHYFWELAAIGHLHHYHLVGQPVAEHSDPEVRSAHMARDPGTEGIWIEGDRLCAALDALGINPPSTHP